MRGEIHPNNKEGESTSCPASADAAPEAVVTENVFYKRVGQPGKTFTLDANGNETEVQAGSAVYQGHYQGKNHALWVRPCLLPRRRVDR